MADEKKSEKLKKSLYYIGYVFLIIVFAFFGWLKISRKCIYIFGIVIESYTFAFISIFAILAFRLYDYLKKNNGNYDFNASILSAAVIISFVCLVNNFAKDYKDSKVKSVIPVSETYENDDISIVLCEVTEFNNMINDYSTHINVYRVNGRIAKKIGFIDELYFSSECIKEGRYDYSLDKEKNTITVKCYYGDFGDDFIMMNPEYATGEIYYIFKID